MLYQSDKFYNEQTRKGKYNIQDLTEVVIPVQLKGMNDWTCYESVSGQIQFEDNNYNYVKMKLTHNAMYLLCVPNYDSTKLLGSNIINAKAIKNIPISKKDHVPNGKGVMLSDLQYSFTEFAFYNPFKDLKIEVTQPVHQLPYHMLEIPEQPPKSFC